MRPRVLESANLVEQKRVNGEEDKENGSFTASAVTNDDLDGDVVNFSPSSKFHTTPPTVYLHAT